ncbi:MAG TPA: hypothetical protein VJ901_00810 [Thermoanaerobaculia bacterium]|nr:hypothetical protein [Thermoanaerobaculia bacterium]
MPNVFLISPANLTGTRAQQLTSPRAQFQTALNYRSDQGVMIGEAFAFMSALYFRGKITYSLHFGGIENTFVITPGFGLVPPDWRITPERMQKMQKIDVNESNRKYTKPLRDSANTLAARLAPTDKVILLGSVATGKYVDVLRPIFGERLRFPVHFAGLGDMSRGGLLLRATRANIELEYTTLDAPRHRAPGASGKMPSLV